MIPNGWGGGLKATAADRANKSIKLG